MTTSSDTKTITFEGPNEVTTYAFLMIRRALKARVEHGLHLLRGQEIKAAQNHGWTTAKTAKKALADMNKIAVDCGMPAI